MTVPDLPVLQGRLLIASPRLGDPNFDRTVVLVLDHGDEGALGVVINRPTHAAVAEILDPWEALAERTPPALVFSGGPVSPSAVIGLARAVGDGGGESVGGRVGDGTGPGAGTGVEDGAGIEEGTGDEGAVSDEAGTGDEAGTLPWRPVLGPVGTVDLSVAPVDQPLALDGIRLFAGYAGWTSGQLETEIEAGAWFVVDARPDDVFAPEPDEVWHDVLRRQGGELALLAGYPPHPSVN